MGLKQLESWPAVSLEEAKAHLRIDTADADDELEALIPAATAFIENETRQSLVDSTFLLALDSFPAGRTIRLPRPPLKSVESVKYLDADGAHQTLSPSLYTVDAVTMPGRIVLHGGESWPATADQANAVEIRFTAGYGDVTDDVPRLLRQGVLLMLGHMWEHREAATDRRIDVVPMAVESIVLQHTFPDAV
jgi:uncharacterized phiE125 gp8 family phage protein